MSVSVVILKHFKDEILTHNTVKYKYINFATDVSVIATFTNLDASVNVDHSTNVGELYTL